MASPIPSPITSEVEAQIRRATHYPHAGYAPHEPTPRQRLALLLNIRELLYGGAAGGGKSDYLLMAALQYVNVPGYAALLLRRTFPQLAKADGLIPRAQEWLAGSDAIWSAKDSMWTFPSGARIEFGHIQHENDKYNYQGAAYQFVGFDELTQFSEDQYRYLISRVRRPSDPGVVLSDVPLRIRAGSNPGGIGHDWVKRRFLTEENDARRFLPAKLGDNPYLDAEEYAAGLQLLDPVTREQLLNGDWTVRKSGGYFKREWVEIVEAPPSDARAVRFWDLAATEPKAGADPDWTVGAKVWEKDGHYFVGPLVRKRISPQGIDSLMLGTARLDGNTVPVRIEQEPGSSGKIAISHFAKLLTGFDVRGLRATGSKLVRFAPFASQCEAGNVSFIDGPWITDCIDELESLPDGSHDDQGDAIAGAFNELAGGGMSFDDALDLMKGAA